MMARTASEQEAINSFLASSFDPGFTPGPLVEEERGLVDAIMRAVEGQFSPLTYILGLALDFTLLAQRLSRLDPEARLFRRKLTEATLLARYELVTKRGKKQVNTLTFKYGAATLGIRTIEESVCDLFIKADRTGYPSAYVYNTGMWHHYKALLVDCFKLSESGRYVVGNLLIDFGLAQFPKNAYFGRTISRVRVFAEVVASYPRAAPGENAGLVFQGIAYGYLKADRPHLSLVVDKVRTGSARQRRFGDIDGYFGLDLEISAEVKDEAVTSANVASEFGAFLRDASNHRIRGLAVVRSIDEAARAVLKARDVTALTAGEMAAIVEAWDWRKQDAALHGLLHFLAHVEQDPRAVKRLLCFIRARDEGHDALAYFVANTSE